MPPKRRLVHQHQPQQYYQQHELERQSVDKNKDWATEMRRNCTSVFKLIILCIIAISTTIFLYKTYNVVNVNRIEIIQPLPPSHFADKQHREPENNNVIETPNGDANKHPRKGSFFEGAPKNAIPKKIDWHDYKYIAYEAKRQGIGEHGVAGFVNADEEEMRTKLFSRNGFNALLSDRISINRSIPDIRHKDCKKIKYLSELPTISVVIPFFNEHWSTLLRTAYSVINRSPSELLVEIILVDDFSDKEFLKEPLDRYISLHLPKVRVVRLSERSGLITARLAGAVKATGDVLVFLDSHTEANVNWLPPLLDPIAQNYKVCVCPFIDVVSYDTFEYRAQDEGRRGAFDWKFYYKRLPLLPKDLENPTKPFASPVMAGGLFAISTKFFWELGGYDEGLDIWGGEQYELSFKIWQCGGAMYDAPCSRIGHIYRGPANFANPRKGTDFVTKNYKRVAEVWMDEYKEYLYMRNSAYSRVDAGDLTKQKAIREKLQCKSFKWFMENVAFDLPLKYPPIDPPDFASGALQNIGDPHYCLDTLNHGEGLPVGIYQCADNKSHPWPNQFFALSWHKDLRLKDGEDCLDVPNSEAGSPVLIYKCHGGQGNQFWQYNPDSKLVMFGQSSNRCLDCDPVKKEVFVSICDKEKKTMLWEFGYKNLTALLNWNKLGAPPDWNA